MCLQLYFQVSDSSLSEISFGKIGDFCDLNTPIHSCSGNKMDNSEKQKDSLSDANSDGKTYRRIVIINFKSFQHKLLYSIALRTFWIFSTIEIEIFMSRNYLQF